MSETKRTFADWIWSLVGVAGIIFIIVAILMLVVPRFSSDPAMDDPEGAARGLWLGARDLLAAGDAEAAVRDLKQAIVLVEGRNPVYLNDLGEALLLTGQGDQAPANWLAAIGLRPFFARPYLNLGRWRDARGERAPALARYRAALALYPEPVPEDLAGRVAELMAEFMERRDEEMVRIGKSLRANPADHEALTVLMLAELALLKVDEDAAPIAGLQAALGKTGGSVGDLKALVARQESGVRDRPDSVVDQAGLGTILLLQGDFARAREIFAAALELSANDRMSNLGAALSAVLSGQFTDVRIVAAAKGFRVNVVAWLALGAALIEQEELENARKVLLTALQLNPSLPETYRLLALTFTGEAGEKDRAAALRGYQRLGN